MANGVLDKMRNKPPLTQAPTTAEADLLGMMGGAVPAGEMPPEAAEGETSPKEQVKMAVADIRTKLDSLESMIEGLS